MLVTLRKLSKLDEYKNLSFMELKRKLFFYKKTGLLFFNEDISDLLFDTSFEIYYFLLPSKSGSKSAFPVPVRYIQYYQSEKEQFDYLKEYFETYYSCEISVEDFIFTYDMKNPYIGTDYVWYFKRNIAG